jgi:hypothetical protein
MTCVPRGLAHDDHHLHHQLHEPDLYERTLKGEA